MNIAKKILSDPVNTWLFSRYGEEIYLVGGYIRDILLGKASIDRDYVIQGDAEEIARHTANKFNGTYIDFKKKGTLRVALKEGKYIDFTQLTSTILDDLGKRDFTVNAIAWSPSQGIIAPPSHIVDLRNRMIKGVDPQNLLDDPLRILRAYRLGAQLTFDIEPHTRKYLRKYAVHLKEIASERITEEIFNLIDLDYSFNYMRLCFKDKVFSQVLPMSQSNYEVTLQQLINFNTLLQQIENTPDSNAIKRHFATKLNQGLTRAGLVRLYLLVRKSIIASYKNKSSSHTWYGHLMLSAAIRKGIKQIAQADVLCHGRITDSRLYDVLRSAYPFTYEMACVLSLIRNVPYERSFLKAGEFNRQRDKPLISGDDVMEVMKVSEGTLIGAVIEKVQRLRFLGQIKSRTGALSWIISNLT